MSKQSFIQIVSLLFVSSAFAQNVGIGVANPTTKLDINGGIKISSFNTIELGGGVAGKEPNAGKIGYRTFTNDALEIVGAGTSTTDRKIYIYGEGGTTINGPINALSTLLINGNSGTPGQVLTSNGTAAPSWSTTSYSNDDKFGVLMTRTGAVSGYLNVVSTVYNLNTSDIAIGGGSIVILKSGLYHFNGTYADTAVNNSDLPNNNYNPGFNISLVFTAGFSYKHPLESDFPLQRNGGLWWYSTRKQFEQDFYITAPTTIQVFFEHINLDYSASNFGPATSMNLFGYRISD